MLIRAAALPRCIQLHISKPKTIGPRTCMAGTLCIHRCSETSDPFVLQHSTVSVVGFLLMWLGGSGVQVVATATAAAMKETCDLMRVPQRDIGAAMRPHIEGCQMKVPLEVCNVPSLEFMLRNVLSFQGCAHNTPVFEVGSFCNN